MKQDAKERFTRLVVFKASELRGESTNPVKVAVGAEDLDDLVWEIIPEWVVVEIGSPFAHQIKFRVELY